MLNIDDATVDEGGGSAEFKVTMSEASAETVTVEYATSDGTARAGSDYTAVRGTLSLPAGDRTGTIRVPVLDDDIAENEKTFTVALSAPNGAAIADGEGLGTIHDDDLDDLDEIARANGRVAEDWLRSFGIVASAHVVDAIDERFRCAGDRRIEERSPGQVPDRWRCGSRYQGPASLVIGGRRFISGVTRPGNSSQWQPDAWPHRDLGAFDEARVDGISYPLRSLTAAETLDSSSFHLSSGEQDSERNFYLWGRGWLTRFDGRDDALALDGIVRSATFGGEFAADRVLAGVAVSHSLGTGSFRRGDGNGESDSSLVGIYPYAHYRVTERFRVWGMAGFGFGNLELSLSDVGSTRNSLTTTMAAAGSRTSILKATAEDRLSLAVESDVLLTRINSQRSRRLDVGSVHASQLRVGIEGSYSLITKYGELVPYLELGVRQDGGSGENGRGVDFGAGFRFAHPLLDLTTEFDVRGLLAHDVESVSEWSVSGSIRRYSHSASDRGLSLRFASSWGADWMPGVGAALRRETAVDSLIDDGTDPRARINAELGYGFPQLNGSGTGTPWVGASLNDQLHDFRLGYRLEIGPSMHIGIEGLIRDGAQVGDPSDRAVMLQLSLQ